MMRFLLLFFTAALLGCAASGPQFQGLQAPQGDEAMLYFYRPHDRAWRNTYLCVYLNGERIGPLRDRGYLAYSLPAVATDIVFKPCSIAQVAPTPGRNTRYEYAIELLPATRHFIRFAVVSGNLAAPDGVLVEEVPEARAIEELQGMRRSE